MTKKAPFRRDFWMHVTIAAFMVAYGIGYAMLRDLGFPGIGCVIIGFAGGVNAGVAIEYYRVKELLGWKEDN